MSRRSSLVAGRYELLRAIGEGSYGVVWEAHDRLTGDLVAVKLLGIGGTSSPQVRREVSALRLLRLPGVARLLDEGIDADAPFLVMDLVDGLPFPGRAARSGPVPWSELSLTAFALLEVLARVHAAGVVHQDLKPGNVLVDKEGRPHLVDFGFARGTSVGREGSDEPSFGGTPHYMAPEQLILRGLSSRTDLYAVGVMLYESLSGRLPHEGGDIASLAHCKLNHEPPKLGQIASGVPAHVSDSVERALKRAPEDRPPSALHFLQALRGHGQADAPDWGLPWVGDPELPSRLAEQLLAGLSVRIRGPAGSGRRALLRRVVRVLDGMGESAIELVPRQRPFSSLERLIGALPSNLAQLGTMTEWVDARLSQRAARGDAPVVVLGAEPPIDAWSRAALERASGVRLLEAGDLTQPELTDERHLTVNLGPASWQDLRCLFGGHDRLFHLREDAARVLFRSTGGLRGRIDSELDAWLASGAARLDGNALQVDRTTLNALELGPGRMAHSVARGAPLLCEPRGLPAEARELLRWVSVAGRNASAPVLAQAMDKPLPQVEAGLSALVERGLVQSIDADHLSLVTGVLTDSWSAQQTAEAHAKIAALLPPGARDRWVHLHEAHGLQDVNLLVSEVSMAAERCALAGDLPSAIAILDEALRLLRRAATTFMPPAVEEATLLAVWTEIALASWTSTVQDRLAYELARADPNGADVPAMATLVRAALALGTDARRALALVDDLAPLTHPTLEVRRHVLRMVAARSTSKEDEHRVLESIEALFARSPTPALGAKLHGFRGRLAYREGYYADAAEHHLRAAAEEAWTTDRIAAELNAASALLEALQPGRALALAERALASARPCRHPFLEARAEWARRAALYRLGQTEGPDLELLDAIQQLGAPDLEALLCYNEAAATYRTPDRPERRPLLRTLATRGIQLWSRAGVQREPVLLLRAMAHYAGEPLTDKVAEALRAQANEAIVFGMGFQILAFLAMVRPALHVAVRSDLQRLGEAIPKELWRQRMDVLCVEEVLGEEEPA